MSQTLIPRTRVQQSKSADTQWPPVRQAWQAAVYFQRHCHDNDCRAARKKVRQSALDQELTKEEKKAKAAEERQRKKDDAALEKAKKKEQK